MSTYENISIEENVSISENKYKIALCCKWNATNHGLIFEERDNNKLINYLQTKLFVHYVFGERSDWDDYESYYPISEQDSSLHYILIKRTYEFADRTFAVKHNGFDKFIKLWRKYCINKMNRYKNVRNLLNRQIFGRRIR
jgi:hypothetical protein